MNTQLESRALGWSIRNSRGRTRRLRGCINNAEVASVFDSRVVGKPEVILSPRFVRWSGCQRLYIPSDYWKLIHWAACGLQMPLRVQDLFRAEPLQTPLVKPLPHNICA